MSRAPARNIVRRVPIQLGVVQEQLDALLVTFRCEHPDNVSAVRCPCHNVPVRQFRIEHRESVVMLRSDGDVLHTRGFCQRHPRRRLKLDRIEEPRQLCVICSIDGPRLHNPFAVAKHAVHSPMNEHPELCVLEPGARLQILRSGRVSSLRGLRVGGLRSRKRRE